ncbi:heme ABC transporter ATP-binding protein [Niallia sp. NCCP-28]|uniref:heme ABC transporter ATP-binding protein n=1 Tax=Niallia sp. NCCP-28 TaxID=2934712 RepID=UPI0020804E77|nr:heme ABC transporter ATP-binding protein [Niallia sp. NCCP-28]GKU84664.1 putative ABC transporter ATP-binding protein YvrA [Niallia sp. NCCP-28]
MLKVDNIFFQYGGRTILSDVSFSVKKGELFGIMGPNGSGKTTLLKLISGIYPCKSGKVYLKGKQIQNYKQKELAKIVAVLSQHAEESFSYQVKEVVALGRYAHQKNWLQSQSKEDQEIVQEAMEITGVSRLQDAAIQELSGGEKQRVYLAQALAQQPEILLLDEPTNHLDLSHQKELLDNLKEWSKKNNLTVISIFHDMNLAGLYCDRLLMLSEGMVEAISSPQQVLQEKMIKKVYQTDVKQIPHPKLAAPQIALLPKTDPSGKKLIIDESYLTASKSHLAMTVPKPLKTLSSGVTGAGVGWYTNFVNRHVDKSYRCDDYQQEMKSYLRANHFIPEQTVGMMTAVYIEDAAYKSIVCQDLSVFIVVTAGVGNAVDAARTMDHSSELLPGTINIWIFVNGELSEEAYIQSVITATEAKASVLRCQQVMDPITGTIATGTSTDSILIAATQEGARAEFAGTIAPLGKLIAAGVTECLTESLKKRNDRMKK